MVLCDTRQEVAHCPWGLLVEGGPGNGQDANCGVGPEGDAAGGGGDQHGLELIEVADGHPTGTGAVLSSLDPIRDKVWRHVALLTTRGQGNMCKGA